VCDCAIRSPSLPTLDYSFFLFKQKKGITQSAALLTAKNGCLSSFPPGARPPLCTPSQLGGHREKGACNKNVIGCAKGTLARAVVKGAMHRGILFGDRTAGGTSDESTNIKKKNAK
jgi:hypothetical protein